MLDALADTTIPIYLGLGLSVSVAGATGAIWGLGSSLGGTPALDGARDPILKLALQPSTSHFRGYSKCSRMWNEVDIIDGVIGELLSDLVLWCQFPGNLNALLKYVFSDLNKVTRLWYLLNGLSLQISRYFLSPFLFLFFFLFWKVSPYIFLTHF